MSESIFTLPIFTDDNGDWNYTWDDISISATVNHVTTSGNAEIKFFRFNGDGKKLLLYNKLNILSPSSQSSLSKQLKGHREAPWTDIITHIANDSMKLSREGEREQEIWPDGDINLTPEYLLEPIIYRDHPTVVFGDYGSLKSWFSLVVAYIVTLPHYDNKLGLTPIDKSTNVLYLDYEDSQEQFKKRWSMISKGFEPIPPVSITYKRMVAPLADSIKQIQTIILQNKIGLIIVDSLGPAASGNLNDTEPAINYNNALRQLKVPSLTLAHNSKDQLTRKKSIFGSIFFSNLARSIWEAKAEHYPGENDTIVSLKQVKASYSMLNSPLGFRFYFSPDGAVSVDKTGLADTKLSGELPLALRIKDLLRSGAMTVKEIAEALESYEATTRTTINRMAGRDQLTKMGASWGLKL